MIKPVITPSETKIAEKLAHKIWNQHYIPLIGKAQVDYMVEKFQSAKAISEQIEKGYEYFLTYHQELPCGYLALVTNEEEKKMMISKIYIDAEFRGLNLGTELLNFAVQEAKNKGCKLLWLTVNKNNFNSIKWYEKRGFEIKEKIEIDIGNGFVMDDYIMEKIIA